MIRLRRPEGELSDRRRLPCLLMVVVVDNSGLEPLEAGDEA
jgi:hypothetical protein